jgi:hypothetical protein
MCAPCSEESARWLDTRPSVLIPRPGFAHGSGAAHDVSPAGMRDKGRARHDEWAATVRFQRALIAAGCQAGHHAEPGVDTSLSCL